MRVLSLTLATVALSGFALAPAGACEWMKMTQRNDATVGQAQPQTPDVLVATNDLADAVVKEMTVKPATEKQPAQ